MDSTLWPDVLGELTNGRDVTRGRAATVVGSIMAGEATDAQIGAFLAALRAKGESAEELAGMVDAMMLAAVTVAFDTPVVDIVGTGGDGFGTFNISTTAALVAAGAGVRVAKHGNRSASSPTGSADLLEALGIDLELGPDAVKAMVEEVGFGFFFAPRYHPAMRHVGPVRKEMGVRTAFNFLGPLCNPGHARLCVGTSDPSMARLMVDVLDARGVDQAYVVHGEDGLDEISTTTATRMMRLVDGEITEETMTPEDFGVERASIDALVGGDVKANVAITRSILDGAKGPRRDAVLVNAAPALLLAGTASGITDAMDQVAASIDTGAAAGVLDAAVAFA